MFLDSPVLFTSVFGAILLAALLTLSIIDIKTYLLPNFLTLPLIALGLFQSWVLDNNLLAGFIGAAAGYSIFVLIETGFKKAVGKDGLGRGDAKLLAAGGAWCGWITLPHIILIASLAGLVLALYAKNFVKQASERIPFGPFLALAIFSVWLAARLAINYS